MLNRKIDKNGYFLEDTFQKVGKYVVSLEVPQGLFRPRWNGSQWEEGLKSSEMLSLFLKNKINSISLAVQSMLDDKALELGFNDFQSGNHMDRAVTYAGYENQFKELALTLANWRSSVWFDLETKMKSGDYDIAGLSVDAVINSLPVYEGI